MAGARPEGRALTEEDVAQLRAQLEEGGRPRVALRQGSGGMPAGTRGTVTRVGVPEHGDEYIQVRIDGDDLPFSPAELALPTRARPRRKTPEPHETEPPRPAPSTPAPSIPGPSGPPVPSGPTPSGSTPSGRTSRTPAPSGLNRERKRDVDVTQPPLPQRTSGAAQAAIPGAGAAAPPAPPAPTRPRGRVRTPAGLEIVLRFADGGWTCELLRGGKRNGRPIALQARAVTDATAALGEETVTRAVEATVAAARAEAEQRAEALRRQLAEAEAALAQFGG